MVLVSNEWLNKGDEVHKTTTGSLNSSGSGPILNISTSSGSLNTTTTNNQKLVGESQAIFVPQGSIGSTINTNGRNSASAGYGTSSGHSTYLKGTKGSSNSYIDGNRRERRQDYNRGGPNTNPSTSTSAAAASSIGTIRPKRGSSSSNRSNKLNSSSEQNFNQNRRSQQFPGERRRQSTSYINNNRTNSNKSFTAENNLINSFETNQKGLRGLEKLQGVAAEDFNAAYRSLTFDSLGNATATPLPGGCYSGNILNSTSTLQQSADLAAVSASDISTYPLISSYSRQASGDQTNLVPANGSGGVGGPVLPYSYISYLGMGVAQNNMQTTQQQSILSSPKNFTGSLTNLSSSSTTPNTSTLMNNNSLSISSNGSNTSTLLSSGSAVTSVSSAAFTVVSADNNNNQAKIVLICDSNSHPFQTRTISLTPNIESKVGRLIAKTKANESNAIFDCKVLSRNHAVLWYSDDGKFWVKDTKSSNGTFINENKLGNEAAQLHSGDIVKFGVDVYENSRQESHGCIIACVKLFLPDGREAISIDGHGSRASISNEGRFSFEEVHRLNMYMQEAAQREKGLKTKLTSIQSVLDTTRKNSALCWQAMINEDQLIHRINSLEKKLQIMEKNVPESALRNEVLKLIDDKNTYQITAKEALGKVYQERCDALQMLSKVEAAYTTSENECILLRDEIMATKQSMQDIHARLMTMETEYCEYRDEISRISLEAKAETEQMLQSLRDQLAEREIERAKLHQEVAQLQNALALQSNKISIKKDISDDEILEKQAIEKLDAAIGDFFADGDAEENETNDDNMNKDDELDALDSLDKAIEDSESNDKKKSKRQDKMKVIRKSTVMKWLKNSDLSKEKGSLDIFKAMCNDTENENETEDDGDFDMDLKLNLGIDENNDDQKVDQDNKNVFGAGAKSISSGNDYEIKYMNLKSVINNVSERLDVFMKELVDSANYKKTYQNLKLNEFDEKYLKELQEENALDGIAQVNDEDGSTKSANESNENNDVENADDEFIIKRNENANENENDKALDDETSNKDFNLNQEQETTFAVLGEKSVSFLQLKKSLELLREAYNDLDKTARPWDIINISKSNKLDKQFTLKPKDEDDSEDNEEDNFTNIHELYAKEEKDLNDLKNKMRDGGTDQAEEEKDQDIEMMNESARSGKSYQSGRFSCVPSPDPHKHSDLYNEAEDNKHKYDEKDFKQIQEQIEEMRCRLHQSESDANHTIEILQIELDTYKMKMNDMLKTIDKLSDEKQELEEALNENNIKIVPGNKVDNSKDGLNKFSKVSPEVPMGSSISYKFNSRGFSASDQGIESDMGGGLTNSSISDLYSCSGRFESDLAEEQINAAAFEREEELIVFKDRLAQEQQTNHDLLLQLEAFKNSSGPLNNCLVRYLVPLGVVAIAILVFLAMQFF